MRTLALLIMLAIPWWLTDTRVPTPGVTGGKQFNENLIEYSEDFTHSSAVNSYYWSGTGIVYIDNLPDPWGSYRATGLTYPGSGNSYLQVICEDMTANALTNYTGYATVSLYVRNLGNSSGATPQLLAYDTNTSTLLQAMINFADDTVPGSAISSVTVGSGFESVGYKAIGDDGWYRVWATANIDGVTIAASTHWDFRFRPFAATTLAGGGCAAVGFQVTRTNRITPYIQTPSVTPDQFYALGFGGGGWLESSIKNGDEILLGSDTTGIYRSTDGGVSFDLFNEGLSDADADYDIHFIADLAASGDTYYAASKGGIYTAEKGGSAWTLMTPHDEFYSTFEHSWGDMNYSIPFTALEVADDDTVYALAGYNRWNFDARRSETYPDSVKACPKGTHTLWRLEGSDWVPDLGFTAATGDTAHGMDIVVETALGVEYKAVSTYGGTWLKKGDGAWASIDSVGISNMPIPHVWSALRGNGNGYLYGSLNHESSGAAYPESQIYVLNMTDKNPAWEAVGGNGTINLDGYTYGGATGNDEMFWVGVWPGSAAADDTLIAGIRSGSDVTHVGGTFDPDNPTDDDFSLLMSYADTDSMGFTDYWGTNPIIDLMTYPGGTVLSMPNTAMMISDDYGATFSSRLSFPTPQSGWQKGTGYHQLCINDVAYTENGIGVIPAGSLIYSGSDSGIYYTNGSDWTVLKHLEPTYDSSPSEADGDVVWDRGSHKMEVWPDLLGTGKDALFFISGEAHSGPNVKPWRLMAYWDPDDDDTFSFSAVSDAIANDHWYAVSAFACIDDTTVAYTATVHSGVPGEEGVARLAEVVDMAEYTGGAWSDLTGPSGYGGYYGTEIIKTRADRVFVASRDGTTDGGIWFWDVGAGSMTACSTDTIGTDIWSLGASHGGEWLYVGTRGGAGGSVGSLYLAQNADDATPVFNRLLNNALPAFGITEPASGGDKYDGTDLTAAQKITKIGGIAVHPADSTHVFLGVERSMNTIAPWCGPWKYVYGSGDLPTRVVGSQESQSRVVKILNDYLVVGYACKDVEYIPLKYVR